jgi:hypothetical protein
MKPAYFLKVTYPIAAVMVRIHSPAVVMRAPRSMVLAVCDMGKAAEWRQRSKGEDGNGAMAALEIIDSDNEIYLTSLNK